MPAHLRDIWRPICQKVNCNAYATKTLYNTRNAEIASYCAKHAGDALRSFKKSRGET